MGIKNSKESILGDNMNDIKTRKTNLEILRIISILMILSYEIIWNTGMGLVFDNFGITKVYSFFIQFGRNIGVDILIILSGYILISDTKLNIFRVIKYILQTFFYSVVIYWIMILLGNKFDIRLFLTSLFPISFKTFGIISTYIILYILHPYINIYLKKIDKSIFIKLLVITTIIWSIIPTIFDTNMASNDLVWFIYLYMVGSYIKLYKDDIKVNSIKYIIYSIIIMIISTTICLLLDNIDMSPISNKGILFNMRSIPTLLSALLLFISFKSMNIKNNKVINLLGISTFGVYIIYKSQDIRDYLGNYIYTIEENTISFIPDTILLLIIVYVVCTIIEILRIYILENNYMKLFKRFSDD